MGNPASRAQAVFNYIATGGEKGRTFDEIADRFEDIIFATQLFDALAKLHRDDVVASRPAVEKPRRYRALVGLAQRHPLYRHRTGG